VVFVSTTKTTRLMLFQEMVAPYRAISFWFGENQDSDLKSPTVSSSHVLFYLYFMVLCYLTGYVSSLVETASLGLERIKEQPTKSYKICSQKTILSSGMWGRCHIPKERTLRSYRHREFKSHQLVTGKQWKLRIHNR
jgi:hypothetical protein